MSLLIYSMNLQCFVLCNHALQPWTRFGESVYLQVLQNGMGYFWAQRNIALNAKQMEKHNFENPIVSTPQNIYFVKCNKTFQ